MSFLQPTYLWGLVALLVPLIIHLLNKGDVQTIKIGSVRYLAERETKQTSQVKWNELLLLLLRLLLLALLVFAMAAPVWEAKKATVPLTYLVEPSLLKNGQLEAFLKDAPEVPVRFLSTDFPPVDDGDAPNEVPNYWQLAKDLQYLESDSIVVFSKASMAGVRGLKPSIPASVFWIPMDELETTDSLVGATAVPNGAVLHTVKSDAGTTDIQNEFKSEGELTLISADSIAVTQEGTAKGIPLNPLDTLRIAMYYDRAFLKDRALLSAAFKAVGAYAGNHVVLEEIADTTLVEETAIDLLVWLHPSPPPRVKGKVMRYKADSLATDLIEKAGEKDVFHLTDRLTIENVLKEGLTAELTELLRPRPHWEATLATLDKRTLAATDFLPNTKPLAPTTGVRQQRSMVTWFWIAALLVLVLERLLAKFRKQ